MLNYRILLSQPSSRMLGVELTIPDAQPDGEVVTLPAWIPGSYMIRDFAKNIIEIAAFDRYGKALLQQLDKQSWRVKGAAGPIRLRYQIYCGDLSVRGAHMDDEHAFFNGTSVFLRVVGRECEEHRVRLGGTPDVVALGWKAYTSMSALDVDMQGFGDYLASGYWDLIEHPFEIGHPEVLDFEVGGCQHQLVITGRYRGSAERLAKDVKRICETQHRMLPRPADLERYLFMLQLVDDGYGGLEHRSSTALIAKRGDMPKSLAATKPDEGYINLLGLCSHEYFHLWNVRRIRPGAIAQSDLAAEAYTRTLWVFEGITSYYDDLMLVRAGVINEEQYLTLLARLITRVARTPGRLKQSLEQSSFEAWSKFYKQDENAPNAIVSYYAKGAILALALDIRLRQAGLRDGLDDIMRRLWDEYGSRDRVLAEDGFYTLLADMAGEEIAGFARRAATGVEDIALAGVFEYLGISWRFEAAANAEDRGGLLDSDATALDGGRLTLGLVHKPDGDALVIQSVMNSGPAEQAGLAAGDRLLALDGLQLTAQNFDSLVQSLEPGVAVSVHLFRRGELKEVQIRPAPAALDTCRLGIDATADSDRQAHRQRWLWQ